MGIGYDIHPLVEGRPLVLGGVEVPFSKGLYGHSDADVLIHALCDAILGALGEGDIGEHFPDDDERYEGVSSLELLRKVAGILAARGLRLVNADCIVHAEEPKISPFKNDMRERIAEVLGVDKSLVSVKATRGEGLGPIGEGSAIAAQAVVLIEAMNDNARGS